MSRPERFVVQARQQLDTLSRRLDRAIPAITAIQKPKLDRISRALPQAIARRISRETESLDALARELDAVGPASVLSRGYTYTLAPDGSVLRSAEAASAAGRLTTVFTDGRVDSNVQGSVPKQIESTPKPKPRRRSRKKPPPGPGLFDAD